MMGNIHIVTNRVAQGVAECQRALALDPKFGLRLRRYRSCQDSLAATPRRQRPTSMRPFGSLRGTIEPIRWIQFVRAAKLRLGRDDEAIACSRRSIEINRNHLSLHNFISRRPPRTSASSMKRKRPSRLALQPIRASPSPASASLGGDNATFLAQRERISRACARPGCRRDERDPETRGDPGRGRRRLQPARGSGRGSHAGAASGLRSDLIDPAIAVPSRARGQAHRRRHPHRVSQRGRRGALRDRSAERP